MKIDLHDSPPKARVLLSVQLCLTLNNSLLSESEATYTILCALGFFGHYTDPPICSCRSRLFLCVIRYRCSRTSHTIALNLLNIQISSNCTNQRRFREEFGLSDQNSVNCSLTGVFCQAFEQSLFTRHFTAQFQVNRAHRILRNGFL